MKRRELLLSLMAASFCSAAPAMAESFSDQIVTQLKGQGYQSISVERTFLGRIRILAERRDGKREIILNPKTGEILRDLWQAGQAGSNGGLRIVDDSSGRDSSGGGTSDGGGSGSGNSGSGSSGGGDDNSDDDSDDDSGDDKDDDRGDDKDDDRGDDRDDDRGDDDEGDDD